MKTIMEIICENGTLLFNKSSHTLGFKDAKSKELNINIDSQFKILRVLKSNKIDEAIYFIESLGNNVIFIDK